MNYWEKRRAKDMYVAMESAEDAVREIADIYAKASRELNYQITKIYERYRDKYHLKDEDAEKLLNVIKDATDINELKRGLQDLKGAEAKELLKEIESPAYRARIERLQNLQQEIDRKMQDVYQQEKQVHTTHYVNQYNNAYYREIYDLKKRTGMDFSYSYVDEKELNRILSADWSGQNYSKRIWGNTQGLARELKEQMALAYLTGKAESDIARELTKKYATAAANARRLVRTESAYMSGQAQAAADRDAGVDKYRILATLDLRTSDKCREMDGKVFTYDDMDVGVNYPPFHPYCRTTVLSVLDDEDLSALKRRSRDPVTGEVKMFPGDIAYQKWYENEVAHNPDALFAERVEKHRLRDMRQYEQYKAVLSKKAVGTISDFREVKYKNHDKYTDLKMDYRKINKYNSIIQSENVITDMLKTTAENLKINMAGLEHRKKSKSSFLRKINKDTDGSRDAKVVKDALDSIGDVLRYTYVAEPGDLVAAFENAINQLEAKGYHFIKVKNTWRKNAVYRGINCTVEAPDGCHTKFELQFHTPESLELKEGKLHKLYEEARDTNTPLERKRELNRQMVELSNALDFPKNIDKIKSRG